MSERFEAYIGHEYDLIIDNCTGKSYNGVSVAEMMNEMYKENRKLSKVLIDKINEVSELEEEIRRWEHEVFLDDG